MFSSLRLSLTVFMPTANVARSPVGLWLPNRVMIEALQNHTPQTIVVDEISNSLEAKACMDIKAR